MGELFEKSSPTPLQKLPNKKSQNRVVSLRTDSRREHKARSGYRKRVGTTKTPRAKKVVYKKMFDGKLTASLPLEGKVSNSPYEFDG